MRRWRGIQSAGLGGALLVVGIGVSGCGSGGGAVMGGGGTTPSASIAGRLSAPAGVPLAGTLVVAEELIGGRTATVRAIAAAPDEAQRTAMVASVQSGVRSGIPGLYTTTAGADGAFVFRGLPPGKYTLTTQLGDKAGVLIGVEVGGARTASTLVLHVTAAGTITGKVRFPHPNEVNPDNSGIMAFVEGTSFIGYTQGASGDYSITNVASQSGPPPYVIGTIATGFADEEVSLPAPFTGATATAPLIYLSPGAIVTGRTIDPTQPNPDLQAVAGVTITALSGQTATSDSNGLFTLRGLHEGSNFLTITKSPYKIIRMEIGPLKASETSYMEIQMRR
jgi:hypothetical protein